MSDSGFPVDPHDLELLRSEEPPDTPTRARARARLAGVIPMGGSAGGGRPGEVGVPRGLGAPSARLAAGHAVAVLAFVMGGVTGAALYAALVKPPPTRVVYVNRPATAPIAAPPSPSAAEVAAEMSTAVPASARLAAPRSSAPRNSASQLSAERIMLDEARAALLHGDPSRALALVERHRRTFSNALLAEERDALEVQSLVKASRFDEARARADAFHKHAPGSLFSSVVDAAIQSIP